METVYEEKLVKDDAFLDVLPLSLSLYVDMFQHNEQNGGIRSPARCARTVWTRVTPCL